MKNILVTGFKPFLNEKINPSELLCDKINQVKRLILPVEYKRSFEILSKEINHLKPDYLIMLGQAAGRENICLEKIGLNWVQTRTSDEVSYVPEIGKINNKEPLALMTTFPIDLAFQNLCTKYPRLQISFFAGTFVCNHLYFQVLSNFLSLQSIFIHVPLLPEQLNKNDSRPSMNLEEMVFFLNDLIDCLRRN